MTIRDDMREKQEETYENIVKLYDYAIELIEFAEEAVSYNNNNKVLENVEPIVSALEALTKCCIEEYKDFVQTNKSPDRFTRKKIVTHINTLFTIANKSIPQLRNDGNFETNITKISTHINKNIIARLTNEWNTEFDNLKTLENIHATA